MSDSLPALFDFGAYARPKPPKNITKSERAELRSIVKGKFKVLRGEVEERRAEMLADIEVKVAQHFAGEDRAWEGFLHVAHEAQMEANRKINDARRAGGFDEGDGDYETIYVRIIPLIKPSLRLDRQEQELLEQLSVGALESDAAQAFLGSIPSVGDLVSADRLSDLERMVNDLELGSGEDDL